ncbi:MAG TPA: acetolactate synthase large subunit [Burkholderiaceae bacterium]|nr:acetolactate synthase large subunit [Burkholderiaceae bacterium]
MNGAESLVATLAANGVELCFANPGTSEMHFVAALDRIAGPRCVLGLFEGVVTGAADGYYRMTGKPAATLLHLGPGLANGLANLHNAKKARSAIVNIVGDHARDHARFESPLKSDIEAIARPVSHWVRTSASARDVAFDGAQALAAARDGALGCIATLVLPADTAWGPGGEPVQASPPAAPAGPDADAVKAAARALHAAGERAVLLVGAGGVGERAAALAAAAARRTGCRVMAEFYSPRTPGGRGRVRIERLPYAVDAALDRLKGCECLVLAGASEPISFFAYPGKPHQLKPAGCSVLQLAEARSDVPAALQALCDELDAPPGAAPAPTAPVGIDAVRASATLDADVIGHALVSLLPEQAIVIDEAVTSGRAFGNRFAAAAPHDWLPVMGGAIGFGLPAALGAAIGAPGRPVLALEGDGSAMYTVQALWSLARESLPVVVVVFANRAYRILQGELKGVGATLSGPKATRMLTLEPPPLDWVSIARGHGVPAASARTPDEFVRELQRGFGSGGPYLIEAVV